MFTSDIADEFSAQLELLNNETRIEKIIIDLRNNPGGFLDQVVDIL
jgi:C-terminal processing protease CtpA/Prc